MEHRHPWCQRLLATLPDEAQRSAIAADDPLWENIETELVKLGSLAHSQVNLTEVAGMCLTLLESKTKDMRVLVQLVRCLQHPAKATPFATALILLESWVDAYWTLAWPASAMQKQRLLVQMVRRFDGALGRVSEQASAAELAQLLGHAERLEQSLLRVAPEKTDPLETLIPALRRAQSRQQEQAKADSAPAPTTASAVVSTRSSSATPEIDTGNERAWRQTQLKVADLIIEQQPDAAVGYRLRRHAIWSTITAAPVASRGNQTQLAPVAADRVSEYEAALPQADSALWKQIEESLVLSPYWFDGHRLSARVAAQLGFPDVAAAIAAELEAFLQRLPALRELAFSDKSAFLPESAAEWLRSAQSSGGQGGQGQDLAAEVAACRKAQGLNAALALLEDKTRQQSEPREQFYAAVMLAELLAAEGMKTLAGQHYYHLLQEAHRLGLAQWEPGLVKRLERFAKAR